MTRRTKIAMALAPLACLLCPAHLLLGVLTIVGAERWAKVLLTAHVHWLSEVIFIVMGIGAVLGLFLWEKRAHRHHCCDHEKKVQQIGCHAGGDIAGGDISR